GRALRVHPGRREGGNRQTVLDSVCVERLVADGAYDLALDVTPDTGNYARLLGGIVSRPVLTVGPWVARVAELGDLVIPDLRVRRTPTRPRSSCRDRIGSAARFAGKGMDPSPRAAGRSPGFPARRAPGVRRRRWSAGWWS